MDFRYKDYLTAPLELLCILHEWEKFESLSKAEMDEYILARLRRICSYAQKHIPYYKKLFQDISFDPEKLTSFEYYRKIPVMNKEIVRQHFDELQSDELKKLGAVICETSGSTGTPLEFYLDKNVNRASFCLFYKTWSMADEWKLGSRQVTLTGYAEGVYQYQWKTNILALSSFHLSEENVELFYSLIKKYKPKVLRGYPSALYLFAKLLEKKGLRLTFKTMFTGAETLLPFQRKYIEEFFGGKIIDHYTHWERTASICNCKCGKLHAQNFYGYHEVVDDNGNPVENGVKGRLVCTGLYNLAMPLLRYDTRDIAIFSVNQTCDCGSLLPVIDSIEGRIEDIVVTPEGRLVGRLDAAFKYSKNIRLANIYQSQKEYITVNIVPDDGYNYESDERPIIEELRKRLGNQIDIRIKYVSESEIPRTKAGKVRFVISEVMKNNDDMKVVERIERG